MAIGGPSSWYGWCLLAGIALSAVLWWRMARRDERLVFVYLGGLIAAFLGAKLAYLVAEGWADWGRPDWGHRWLTGKSIVGALLGGYAGVEGVKRLVGYRAVTGDWFASIVPMGVLVGRLGCKLQGCCPGRPVAPSWFTSLDAGGVARWPAVEAEILFNAMALAGAALGRWRGWLPGQHFHLYLMAYGTFRFGHEFLRDTPRLPGGLSGYQILAVGMTFFGWAAFRRRAREVAPANPRLSGDAHRF